MSEQFKCEFAGSDRAIHYGICEIKNVPETIATNDGGTEGWLFYLNGFFGRMYLKLCSIDKSVSPVVELTRAATIHPKIPIYLNILSSNPKFQNKHRMETIVKGGIPLRGPHIPISVFLDSKNGFLNENGAMKVEYGLHFDSLVDEKQRIWKFNLILFHDSNSKIFNETHETDILKVTENFKNDDFENFLRIAHGVQLKFDVRELLDVVYIAHEYKIQNVLKNCDRHLLLNIQEFSEDDFLKIFPKKSHLGAISKLIMDASQYNLNQLLAFLLKYLFEIWDVHHKSFFLENSTWKK